MLSSCIYARNLRPAHSKSSVGADLHDSSVATLRLSFSGSSARIQGKNDSTSFQEFATSYTGGQKAKLQMKCGHKALERKQKMSKAAWNRKADTRTTFLSALLTKQKHVCGRRSKFLQYHTFYNISPTLTQQTPFQQSHWTAIVWISRWAVGFTTPWTRLNPISPKTILSLGSGFQTPIFLSVQLFNSFSPAWTAN